jgi:hypothetical protein
MKKILALMAAAVVTLALTQSASAVQISGKVDMVGTLNLDAGSLATASAVTAFGPATVIPTPNGAFLGTAGSAVTFTPFSWNPASTPVNPLWSFVSGGWTYTFDLNNITFVSQNAAFVNLAGNGILNITGLGSPYDATFGNWTFTITSAGADPEFRFGFVSSTAAVPQQVPDGGMTVALLGLALVGVEGLRRKLTK